jgi:hypothetical protein
MPTNFPTSVDVLVNPTPTDSLNAPAHSTQHANANDAIEAIEAYLLTGSGNAGLVKIIPSSATNGTVAANGDVTIGSAVSSVTVSGAFNSTFENYFIKVSGGAATGNLFMTLRLGATTSEYYAIGTQQDFNSSTISAINSFNAANFTLAVICTANALSGQIFLDMPQLAKTTVARYQGTGTTTGYVRTDIQGFVNNTTQYTSFTLTTNTGTVTGGTIRIYGYK